MELVLLQLAVILLAAKLAAEVCERLGHNAALGELLAGLFVVVVFPSIVSSGMEVIQVLASLGIIFMIFMVGLESRLEDLRLVEKPAFMAAVGGSVFPFLLGFFPVIYFGYGYVEALFVATALTASSIGVTAKVFMDMGKIRSRVAEIILGAAVIDDVLSLLFLALVLGATLTGSFFIGETLSQILFFWFILLPLGWIFVPKIMGVVHSMKAEGSLLVISLVIVFIFSFVSEEIGFAAIVGAFAAGIIFSRIRESGRLTQNMYPLYYFLTPIFFVSIGLMVDLQSFYEVLGLGIVITIAAIISKIIGAAVGSMAVGVKAEESLLVGVGMLPRGEVALIIISLALANGLVDLPLYSAVVFMVVVTIFITPLILNILYKKVKIEEKGAGW
ncbi:cation:proton antiporter [Candidatus Altiarchaeota archaeon]